MKRSRYRALAAAAAAVALAGCASLGYYAQAVGGHLDVINRARPIEELLAEPLLDDGRRQMFRRVLEIRDFSVRVLALPDNDSYRRYSDLARPYAIWNVFAAPALSLEPKRWCFPFAGCVAYRGYFAQAEAERFAAELTQAGFDVHVAGVAAYSTLGWFDDPMLNTILERGEIYVASTMFHELAHQVVYLKGDTAFNESFAVAVETEGMRRWLAQLGREEDFERYREQKRRRDAFTELVLRYRARLAEVYASALPPEEKLARKRETFAALKAEYRERRGQWGGGYDRWFERDLNNAHVLSVGLYHRHVGAFGALLAEHHGKLPEFYESARELARLERVQREEKLSALAAKAQAARAEPPK